MSAAERRKEIMKILFRRRRETIHNLAIELGVSERTIRRDINNLSLYEPIYTQTGRYEGGVYIMENYTLTHLYMTVEETTALKKLLLHAKECTYCKITLSEIIFLEQIIKKYSLPEHKKG